MIRVFGAGAFGTALAISLAKFGPVSLWTRNNEHADQMVDCRENKLRLPGFALPHTLTVERENACMQKADLNLLAIPTQKLRGFLEKYGFLLGSAPLIACCKGVEVKTGLSPTQILFEHSPDTQNAIITGPSFATDIANGLPTALTLACADKEAGKAMQSQLNTPQIRLYRTSDVIGAEFGGAMKNVIAIGCGAVMGAGLGESARAALMTRGFAEISRIALVKGAISETLSGLSGFGDLVLTCTSEQSRNYRFGKSLGLGFEFDNETTVEGLSTAHAVTQEAMKLGVEVPITEAVWNFAQGNLQIQDAMNMLLTRPLKEE